MRHHFSNGYTIWAFVITHNLTSFQDCLLLRAFVPRTLVLLALQETNVPWSQGGCDNFCCNPALGCVIPCLEFWLARKAKSSEFFVSRVGIYGSPASWDRRRFIETAVSRGFKKMQLLQEERLTRQNVHIGWFPDLWFAIHFV